MKCKCGKSSIVSISVKDGDADLHHVKVNIEDKTINCTSCDFDYMPHIDCSDLIFKTLEKRFAAQEKAE